MKKILSFLTSISIILSLTLTISAEEYEIEGLSEKLDALFIKGKFSDEHNDELMEIWEHRHREDLEDPKIPWDAYVKTYRYVVPQIKNQTKEEGIESIIEYLRPDFNTGILVSCINDRWYINQYAKAGCFEYMFEGREKYWEVFRNNTCIRGTLLKENGEAVRSVDEMFKGNIIMIVTDDSMEFLYDKERISGLLKDESIKKVNDIRLFYLLDTGYMYLSTDKGEYLIEIKGDDYRRDKDGNLPVIKKFILYKATEVTEQLYKSIKPTYEEEAQALQDAGLLYGNEKGLDLLKPLTRIEAAALLLRALGKESAQAQPEQVFADVPVSHWGCAAAESANRLGIVKGVGDNKFAPDRGVTLEEFATMALRAAGEQDFDWEKAAEILTERGIITEEQTKTMDLFTRGDMAKIIYEAREHGMFGSIAG